MFLLRDMEGIKIKMLERTWKGQKTNWDEIWEKNFKKWGEPVKIWEWFIRRICEILKKYIEICCNVIHVFKETGTELYGEKLIKLPIFHSSSMGSFWTPFSCSGFLLKVKFTLSSYSKFLPIFIHGPFLCSFKIFWFPQAFPKSIQSICNNVLPQNHCKMFSIGNGAFGF